MKNITILLNGLIHDSINITLQKIQDNFKNYELSIIISTWKSESIKVEIIKSDIVKDIIYHDDITHQELLSSGFPLSRQLQNGPVEWIPGVVGHYSNFINVKNSLQKLDLDDSNLVIKSRTDLEFTTLEEIRLEDYDFNKEVVTFPTYWGGQLSMMQHFCNDHFLISNRKSIDNIYSKVDNMKNEFQNFWNPEMYMNYLILSSGYSISRIESDIYQLRKGESVSNMKN
jgi:hypothetical protein